MDKDADMKAKELGRWKRKARAMMKRGAFYFVLDGGAWLDPCTMTRGTLDHVQEAWLAERRRLGLEAD